MQPHFYFSEDDNDDERICMKVNMNMYRLLGESITSAHVPPHPAESSKAEEKSVRDRNNRPSKEEGC